MPYKTIQQNFANGELNPKMQGRSDVDMYYKSAQKMREVVTTPYGGFVRRPGSVNLYRGAEGLQKIENLTASTQLTADANYPVANLTDGSKETSFKASGTVAMGTALVTVADPLESGTTEKTYYAYKGNRRTWYAFRGISASLMYNTIYSVKRYPTSGDDLFVFHEGAWRNITNDFYKFVSFSKETGVLKTTYKFFTTTYASEHIYDSSLNEFEGEDYNVYLYEEYPILGDSIFSDTNGTFIDKIDSLNNGVITCTSGEFIRNADGDITVTEEEQPQVKNARKVAVYGISSNADLIVSSGGQEIGRIKASDTKQDLFFDVEIDGFISLSFYQEQEGNAEIEIEEVEVLFEEEKSVVRLLPFVFNNAESYILSVTNGVIRVFRKDELVTQIDAPFFTYDIIKTLRYTQTADTAIFVHPNLHPMILVRNSAENTWVLKRMDLSSIPTYNFDSVAPKTGEGTLTPSAVDGTVKLTLSAAVSDNLVGQYIEGNGGRVKITSQNGTTLNGYTVIGFYTEDTIQAGNWTYTTSYEPVWSESRGWPCSVTFHQGRLWFGGSKSRPQTVWGSKVGLFYKFDPTGGYDNDAIEFTLDTDTLNKITDLYSMRNLLIFTLGGEFVCQTSYNEPITPKNVNASKQTSNGSWENTQPVDMEGSVIFVERKGQALMNFAYLGDETYNSNNASLINSHLINQPEDLDVERNNLTQQTNYVYIVNKDGTMCVVNLLAAQGITGGFTLWNTQGKVKSVCVLPDATYIAVERNAETSNPIYIEKLDWNNLTDNAKVVTLNEATQFTVPHLAGNTVDVLCDGKFVGKYKADEEGLVVFSKPLTGKVEIGLPFRSYVQSNFLEVPQMGTGVGKMKRLATMVVRVLDTPEVTINGETQKGKGEGVEDIHFYGIGDWDEKPTWEFTQNTPYKFNVLAAQMDLNYQLSNESY